MAQPILRTDRLVLVPLSDEHLEHEVAMDADAEVLTFVRSFHEHYDEPLPGSEQGEVEYELTRDAWARMAR